MRKSTFTLFPPRIEENKEKKKISCFEGKKKSTGNFLGTLTRFWGGGVLIPCLFFFKKKKKIFLIFY